MSASGTSTRTCLESWSASTADAGRRRMASSLRAGVAGNSVPASARHRRPRRPACPSRDDPGSRWAADDVGRTQDAGLAPFAAAPRTAERTLNIAPRPSPRLFDDERDRRRPRQGLRIRDEPRTPAPESLRVVDPLSLPPSASNTPWQKGRRVPLSMSVHGRSRPYHRPE